MPRNPMFFGDAKEENMYVSFENCKAVMYGERNDVIRMLASTFPLGVAPGMPIQRILVDVPEERLQACAFHITSPTVNGMRHRIALLLFWNEGEKKIGYDINGSSINAPRAKDIAQFNPFVIGEGGIVVADATRSVRYIHEGTPPAQILESGWTVKTVSIDATLRYICKQITLEELDAAAESEQRARDKLAETKAELDKYRVWTQEQYERAEAAVARAEAAERHWVALEEAVYDTLKGLRWLYHSHQLVRMIVFGLRNYHRLVRLSGGGEKKEAHHTPQNIGR